MSHDDDVNTNPSQNPHINDLIDQRLRDPRRRGLLKGGMGLAALSFIGSTSVLLAGCNDDDDAASAPTPPPSPPARPSALGFGAIQKSTADSIAIAAGYNASVLFRLGDPLAAAIPAYLNNGMDSAASFAQRAGDHHDGMHYFGLSAAGTFSAASSDRGLLVQNHEAITPAFLHPAGQTIVSGARTVADEVLREFYVHGVSIIEVQRAAGGGGWSYKQDSAFNRRVHTLTETELSGPARSSAQMITKFSTNGIRTRGTVNNCANGYTPWYTYLACEENWAGYFRRVTATDNPNRTAKEITSFNRYGVGGNGRELWATVAPDTPDNLYGRWNAMKRGTSADGSDDYRNAPNTYGWNVEIDPFNPNSVPRKRTAMGRFAHEGAWPAKATAGKPVVFYMGCDSRNEYVYKYVSTATWNPADAAGGIAAGDKYLDAGKLYVAKFNATGTGQWIELSQSNPTVAGYTAYPFANEADVLINARLAADAVGATKMDRPEWGAVDPVNGDVYLTLTNNNATLRPLAATDAANPRHYNDPRTDGTAQRGNPNGHIIRWRETSPEVLTFTWDIFLFGARANVTDANNINVSALTADNDFSSPDGLWFSTATNLCWIQTDDGAYTDVTNCMMLAALPGGVGDGGPRTITSTDAMGATKQTQTFVGAAPGTKMRRFLVGPKDCEITGVAETPDGNTLFVNIQHPGEDTPAGQVGNPAMYTSHWPDGGTARPRSATIAITKNGGGPIGV